MNVYDILTDIIKKCIQDEDLKELDDNLMRLPFEKLNQKTLDTLLSMFINHCVLFNSSNAIKKIFEVWYRMLDVEAGQLDHLTRLFTDVTISYAAQLLVSKTFIEEKPLEYYMTHLINYDNSPITLLAAKNLEQFFTVSNHTWAYLFEISVENEIHKGYTNHLIKDYIETKMVESSKYLSAPEWIINEYDYLPNMNELNIEYKIPVKTIDQLLVDLSDTQDEMDQIENYYNSLNENDQKIMLDKYSKQKYRQQLNFNNELFKIYGPANTQIARDLTDEHICSKYGCRMLLCRELEIQEINHDEVDDFDVNYEIDNYDKSDWFTNQCDKCFNHIQFRHYAVRLPLHTGNWLGCYCSWKCVRDTLSDTDVVEHELINIFEEQLLKIGIQDRRE